MLICIYNVFTSYLIALIIQGCNEIVVVYLIKVNLQSEDYGKHLIGVEDLLQKHSILESDITIVGARVLTINEQAQTFVDTDFPDVGGQLNYLLMIF